MEDLSENSENIGEFWRRDTGLVLKRTRGRSLRKFREYWSVLAKRHWSGVEAYKRKICQKIQRILARFGEETLVWCCRVQEEDLSQKNQIILACFGE